jgi:hypothetical protein
MPEGVRKVFDEELAKFKAHWISNMVLALPVITLGVLLGPVIVYIKPTFQIHLANAHEVNLITVRRRV